ncbi:hypothetical protein O6P43_028140 [Quillaja saponaria]|uniref:Uncharacterized protein n=1 Tax=Quillaja saponaria TaxID=32244 RepID=A0AAD7KX79_QUISA|nr:hypothetical protein O6P43_028140 [Quillaja saponaria]
MNPANMIPHHGHGYYNPYGYYDSVSLYYDDLYARYKAENLPALAYENVYLHNAMLPCYPYGYPPNYGTFYRGIDPYTSYPSYYETPIRAFPPSPPPLKLHPMYTPETTCTIM